MLLNALLDEAKATVKKVEEDKNTLQKMCERVKSVLKGDQDSGI